MAVAKGASLVAGWALSRGSKEDYWSLYKAVWTGVRKVEQDEGPRMAIGDSDNGGDRRGC